MQKELQAAADEGYEYVDQTVFESFFAGEEVVVSTGDVVFAPAGESHWHGALEDTTFAHITVTRRGSETTQTES